MFRVVYVESDGSRVDDDEVFETRAEAQERGHELANSYATGGEVLHLSNPGDHPESDDELEWEVVEF